MSIPTKHVISLSEEEKNKIHEFLNKEVKSQRLILRAKILLELDNKKNVINEYVEIGLEPTLTYKRNPNSNRKKKNAN